MTKKDKFYKNKRYWVIILSIILGLCIIIGLNTQLVKNAEKVKMQSEGQLRLTNIASQVENSLSQSKSYAESYAAQLEIMIEKGEMDEANIYSFIHSQNEILYKKTNGVCTATYIAYNKKLYIENFIPDDSFTLTERIWYVGAERSNGNIFITNPYVDANTEEICYSISMLLDDGSTIVGLDFTMQDIQDYIKEMNKEIDGISMIINSTGMIVGYNDSRYIGQNYDLLPYKELIDKVFNLYGNYFEYTSYENIKYTVFSDRTSTGWYLIVCLPSSMIYSEVNQSSLLITVIMILLGIGIIALITVIYQKTLTLQYETRQKERRIDEAILSLKRSANTIINQADMADQISTVDGREFISSIRATSRDLFDDIENISAYQDIEDKNSQKQNNKAFSVENNNSNAKRHLRQGAAIVVVLLVAAIVSISINSYTQRNYIDARMKTESEEYFSQVRSWVDTNITLTNDLALHMGAQPNFYQDYENAVKYLNDVVKNNSDISVAYIVNPKWDHTVIMNNGWEPTDPSWHVEERDWYVNTILSSNGFNISTPYQDEQTGMYCVTFSQIVYDSSSNIVGIIGIDFYMDTLIDILGQSYTANGYAFLTDPSYTILNHPYDQYQMSSDNAVNAGDTVYRGVFLNNDITTLTDYDGVRKVAVCQSENKSGFTVITIKNRWDIYSMLVISNSVLLLVFAVSISLVLIIIRYMTKWQEKVNYELKIAADEAIAAGNAKSDFLANMSHEIRTPINAVLGMNEMIQRESKDPNILEYSADIQSAGKNLLSIINDILDFSKIESGKMTLVPAEYDVSSIVNDLVNLIDNRAKSKNLQLNIDIDSNLPATLYGDEVRLCQVITNILTNAVKYTDKGSVTLTMKLADKDIKPVKDENVRLYIAVTDTGRGIKKEDINKLYQTFTRIDEKNTRNIEGTGLGINITSSLLKLMESELYVDSEYGKGSTFSFTVTQKVISAEPIGDYKERFRRQFQVEKNNKSHIYAPDAKILIVDDTEMNLKVEANLLKRTQAQIDAATNGPMALEMIEKNKYDIIFLDHMMPGMDGIETLQKAKEKDILKGTPVIALTANAIAGAKEKYLDAGFDDYLSKPVKGKDIEKMLCKYISSDLLKEIVE